jgi:hypothetical protein
MLYTSKATEFGRGARLGRLTDAPLDTPNVGTYELPSSFVNKTAQFQAEQKEALALRREYEAQIRAQEAAEKAA